MGKLDIPIIECADYMETSSLGRAEWMRFYGLLFGKAAEADSLFARVEADYLRWAGKVADIENKPTVFADLKSGARGMCRVDAVRSDGRLPMPVPTMFSVI